MIDSKQRVYLLLAVHYCLKGCKMKKLYELDPSKEFNDGDRVVVSIKENNPSKIIKVNVI